MKSETNQKLSKIVLTGHFHSTDDIISEEDTTEIIIDKNDFLKAENEKLKAENKKLKAEIA